MLETQGYHSMKPLCRRGRRFNWPPLDLDEDNEPEDLSNLMQLWGHPGGSSSIAAPLKGASGVSSPVAWLA